MDAHTATQNTAFLAASFELLPMLTVEENIIFPLRLTGTTADPGWIASVLRAVEMDGRGQARPLVELTVVLATGDAADAALAGHVGDAAA